MRSPAHGTMALAVAVLVLFASAANVQSQQGRGNGQYRIEPFVELQTTDGTIATLSATPTTDDPGPIVFDATDALVFSGRWTNARHAVIAEVASATDDAGASQKMIQGTMHTIAQWVHVRQDDASAFGTVTQTGVSVADGSSFIVPGSFDKDGQGTVTLQTYAVADPTAGATVHVVYWAYDAGKDAYWFDATDPDFTNDNGETRVYPVSHLGQMRYTFPLTTLDYGVAAVGSAAQGYVPTVALAWDMQPGAASGNEFALYVLIDFPAGTPTSGHDYTLQATVHSLR